MSVFNKHRPVVFTDLVLATPQLQRHLRDYAEGRRSESLLLHGPYGTGKSSVAEVIQLERLAAAKNPNRPYVIEARERNASTESAIINTWNIEWFGDVAYPRVIINEVDRLKARQLDVVTLFDKYASHGFGFILTTNYLHEIDPSLKSRMDIVEVPMPPPNAWINRVTAVLAAEGVQVTPEQALCLAEAGHVSIREIGKAMDQLIARQSSSARAVNAVV
jgi:DNA polymerase III delta prime subunit